MANAIIVHVDSTELDEATKKASKLNELLKEAKELIQTLNTERN